MSILFTIISYSPPFYVPDSYTLKCIHVDNNVYKQNNDISGETENWPEKTCSPRLGRITARITS